MLEYRFNTWQLPAAVARSSTTAPPVGDLREHPRPANAAPATSAATSKIATFNVLNYFNTTGQAVRRQRAPPRRLHGQHPVLLLRRPPGHPDRQQHLRRGDQRRQRRQRSAWAQRRRRASSGSEAEDRHRDQRHRRRRRSASRRSRTSVEAASARPTATTRSRSLVAALNAPMPGAGTWKFVHSPGEAIAVGPGRRAGRHPAGVHLPSIDRRGRSASPTSSSATTEFANAREPLAQAFKAKGALDDRRVRRDPQPLQVQGRQQPRRPPATTPTTPTRVRSTVTGPVRPPASPSSPTTSPRRATSRRCSSPVTSTPTPRRTRSGPSRTAASSWSTPPTRRRATPSPGLSGSLDHVLANQAGLDTGHRRRHLGHQRRRVGRLPVQPVQLQRHRLLAAEPAVRGLRPQPGDHRHLTSRR